MNRTEREREREKPFRFEDTDFQRFHLVRSENRAVKQDFGVLPSVIFMTWLRGGRGAKHDTFHLIYE